MENFTYDELNEIWWALATKIHHVMHTDGCNLIQLNKLSDLQVKVENMRNDMKKGD